jgi:hypothetical protein
MTAEPGHEPTEWENVPRPTTDSTPAAQPVHYNSARHGSHVEESPELLRWRADLLMDEMMMGGVDVSAADGNRTFSGVDTPLAQRSQPPVHSSPYPTDFGRSPREDRDEYERGGYEGSAYTRRTENGNVNGSHFAGGGNAADTNAHTNSAHNDPSTNGNGGSYSSVETERPAASSDIYRSPSSSDHFTGESALPSQPSLSTNEITPSSAPASYDDELSGRGISAPRRYPDQHPDPVVGPSAEPGDRSAGQPQAQAARAEDQARPTQPLEEPTEPPAYPPPLRTTMEGAPAYGSGEQAPRTDRLYSVEQQYEQFRREQSANIQPVEPPRPATRPPLPPVEPPRPSVPPRVTPPPVDEHTRWATGADKWEYQDFSADPNAQEEDPLFGDYLTSERRHTQESAVRHDPAQFVSAMSVYDTKKKRTTLLPRSTELDIDTLHREITDLHSEIAALLPVGNETSERARHLLDKAYSILQSDPSRSAEVEYYMQQVRTIVQRLYQARQWSDLYRQRLHVYLLGWLGLSAMVLIARFLFQIDLEDMLMWVTGLSADSRLMEHWATFVGTVGAGAFGGALGALYTMQGHARSEYSFFDRKYGLRGLILPFMGAIVGGLGYILFGVVFALVGINPAQSLTAAIVPTMSAFAFGFSQESIYGTRD